MKTPRELLLEKHRVAEPALDAMRREVVNDCRRRREESLNGPSALHAPHSVSDQSLLTSAPTGEGWPALAKHLLASVWTELFVPCRRVWLGLGAAWCLILVLQMTSREEASQSARGPAPKAEEVIASLQENKQRILAELGMATLQPAAREPDPVTRPRSERVQAVAMA